MLNKILAAYRWYDHQEGLKFVETHRDDYRTSGHWLLLPGSFSAFHRVTDNEELWYIHHGRIILHILNENGELWTKILGVNIDDGENPVISVPKNCWQAAEIEPGVEYGFGSVVCAPAFKFENFEIANRSNLIAQYPSYTKLITRLTLS